MLDRVAVRALHIEGAGVREIARMLGASRNAVRRALDPEAPAHYRRTSALDDLEPAVRAVLCEYPLMPTARVAAHVSWHGSVRHLSSLVAALRAEIVATAAAGAPVAAGATVAVGRCATKRLAAGTVEMGRTTWR